MASPGIQTDQFIDEVNPDFVCSICFTVLLNPVSTPCDHHFCKYCVGKWINTGNHNCPTCRAPLLYSDLKPMSRIIMNILGSLKLRCPNSVEGCQEIISYQDLEQHEDFCLFDKSKFVLCRKCNCRFKYVDIDDHMENCVNKLYMERDALLVELIKLQFQRNLFFSLLIFAIVVCVALMFNLSMP